MNLQAPAIQGNSPRRGFVLVTTVLSTVALLAFLGLAVDVGYLQLLKTRMQNAADAAALGGVQQIRMSGSSGAAAAAKNDAALNGFTDGVNGVTVTVNTPPATGYSTGDASGVEVVISETAPALFMELVAGSSTTVCARAVAHQGSGTGSLFVLDPAAKSSLSASGGVTVQVKGGVVVNSSNSQALTVSGGSHLTAASISVVGNYSVTGGSSITPASPATGVAAGGDPLANVPAPAVGNCNHIGLALGWAAGTQQLYPGVYCNGISVGNGAKANFNPGTYILEGGGLTLNGGTTNTGTGVTFYDTAGGGYSYGPISISNGASATFVAPTTGSLAGILFFGDRGIAGGAASSLTGGATAMLQGALYFPTTALTYSGGVALPAAYTLIVAKTVNISGGVTLNNDFSSLPGGSPVKGSATLSE